MGSAFDRSIFDEPDSLDAAAPKEVQGRSDLRDRPRRLGALRRRGAADVEPGDRSRPGVVAPTLLLALALCSCYIGKVVTVSHLDRRGGDARAYVKSSLLVVDGPYAWSRHPTYALAMLQFLIWSALAFYLQIFMAWNPLMLAAASAVADRVLPYQRLGGDADRGGDAAFASP